VKKNEIPRNVNIEPIRNDKTQPILPSETDVLIGKAVQQMNQTGQIQPSPITRVKSQTIFTYSNRPLENVSPAKFVVNSQNGGINQQPIVVPQLNS
jgi:hypothetical protein